MWASRSFLMTRPLTLLLNSIRRRVNEPPAVSLGAASRWLVSDSSDGDGRHNDVKKHLYPVLDDVKYGFGIHKLDMDTDAHDVAAAVGFDSGDLPRLPNPPVLRYDEKWIEHFAVLGSTVIGMAPRLSETYTEDRSDGNTLTFDTKTAKLALLPDLPDGVRNNMPMHCIAAGDKLYVIETDTVYDGTDYDSELFMGGLHCLKLHPQGDDTSHAGYPKDEPGWCWHVSNSYYYTKSPWFWSCDPQKLPLSPYSITAHAVHPSGHAFFVSAHCHRGWCTFSYDTEHGHWTRHGDDWELPFIGQAQYDHSLNAWVGLHAQRDGHICACDVPDLNGPAAPKGKLGKEKLFYYDPERHVDAKLVGMGGGGRFCVVEIMTMPGVDRKGCIGDGDKCVLRLTAFRVEYDDDGELTVADRRPARSFRMSKYRDYVYSDSWLAFWA
ncbi:hypothetical protein HU200_040616 [Digitaria exilis]|uniref:Uncharacterized protein n=1 Tax=Digitaria exilis TaxID=1010633 RepID=A0A835B8Z3_9POAL|nr:hypothetical protein HU200_040616 [Digitaria exilis]CAB3449284.1 unnamed protein product [Digitaria exilis]